MDTSVLVKKYIIAEQGVDRVVEILAKADEVVVSPITRIEAYHVFHRLHQEGYLADLDLRKVEVDFDRDHEFFHLVAFNESLEREVIRIMKKSALRSLDAIHLASALAAGAEMFYTADRKFFTEARKIMHKIELI